LFHAPVAAEAARQVPKDQPATAAISLILFTPPPDGMRPDTAEEY
jgi:hypothetical protein